MSQPAPYTAILDQQTNVAAGVTGPSKALVLGIDPERDILWDVSFELVCTAISGTNPTLDVTVETTSEPVAAPVQWAPTQAFTQVTAPIAQVPNNPGVPGSKIRARSTIGGTTPLVSYVVLVRSNKPFTLQ